MKITENAIEQMKAFVKPDSGLAEGIRIFQGNGCCGTSFGMSVVKQPYSTDLKEHHSGINIYLDNQLAPLSDMLVIDYFNERFQLSGIPQVGSGCC